LELLNADDLVVTAENEWKDNVGNVKS